jgi:hypothetical protein
MRKNKSLMLVTPFLVFFGAASAQEVIEVPEVSAETPFVLVSDGDGIVPFRCPIEQIRNAYQNLVNPDDTLMALAIEKQTLAICRQSQEALIRIAENEVRLRELFEPIMMPTPPGSEAEPPIAQIMASDPARNVMETIPLQPLLQQEAMIEPVPAVEPPAPKTDFILGVLMRDPEGWKAILVRGEEMFTVRSGDEVTDGVRVTGIDEIRVTIEDPDGNVFILE